MKRRKLVFRSDFTNHYMEVAIFITFYLCLFLFYRILINNSARVRAASESSSNWEGFDMNRMV